MREKGEDINISIHDIDLLLRASQTHINPGHSEVAKLITKELKWATEIIRTASVSIHFIVGEESLSADQLVANRSSQSETVVVEAGSEIIFQGVEDEVITADRGEKSLRITPEELARSLMKGGRLFTANTNGEQGHGREAENEKPSKDHSAQKPISVTKLESIKQVSTS
jgi:hypothetical protein